MKITLKTLFIMKGFVIAGLVIWGVFLMKNETKLKLEVQELEQNYHALDAYNEVLKYDLETSRDSVRILEQKIDNLEITIDN